MHLSGPSSLDQTEILSLKFTLWSQGNRGPVIQQTGIEEKTRKERREWRGEKRWRREKGEMRKEREEGSREGGRGLSRMNAAMVQESRDTNSSPTSPAASL